jgi:zinc protease
MASFKAPALKEEDYPALVLATQILDNRLFEEVRTKRGLTYSVHCMLGNSASNSGSLYVSSTQLSEAVKVIFDEVKKLQTEVIEPAQIELQIRKFRSSWFLGRETSSSQTRIFSLYEMIGTGWKDANTFISRLNTVTPEKLQAAAKNYLKDYTFAIAGPDKVDVFKIIGANSTGAPTTESGTKAKSGKQNSKTSPASPQIAPEPKKPAEKSTEKSTLPPEPPKIQIVPKTTTK